MVLSTENHFGQSVAALGVAAHETGQAIQHARGYAPLQLRTAAVGMTTIASQVVKWPLGSCLRMSSRLKPASC